MIDRTPDQVVRAYRDGASNAVAAKRLQCCARKAAWFRRREKIPAAKPWTTAPAAEAPPKGPRRKRPLKRTSEQLDAVFSREGGDRFAPGYGSPAEIRELLGGVSRARVSQLRARWRTWKADQEES